MSEPPKKKTAFQRFWKNKGSAQIIALIITLFLCAMAGGRLGYLPVSVWVLIGLVFWLVRLYLNFRMWLRSGEDEERRGR